MVELLSKGEQGHQTGLASCAYDLCRSHEPLPSEIPFVWITVLLCTFSSYSFYQYITTLTTWFIIIVLIGSYVFLPFIFRLIKAEYMNSYNIYLVLSISAIFLYNAAFRSSYLTIINKGKVLMISQLISVFVNIVLNIYLITKLNMIGAALATVIMPNSPCLICTPKQKNNGS